MLSYAQNLEDVYLWRCFGAQTVGYYIDIGAGHPVVDNVSYAFYLAGWNGLTVEPNARLAALARRLRSRDQVEELLVGAAPGEADFYLVEGYHGLSTTVVEHAREAEDVYAKRHSRLRLPVVTLAELCRRHVDGPIDFLKIDVEGAEPGVIAGSDWAQFRPKVIIVEATLPARPDPAWDGFEPTLLAQAYELAWFDGLNRYYVAAECADLRRHFEVPPNPFDGFTRFDRFGPALDDPRHPDHALARGLAAAFLAALPDLEPTLLAKLADGPPPDDTALARIAGSYPS